MILCRQHTAELGPVWKQSGKLYGNCCGEDCISDCGGGGNRGQKLPAMLVYTVVTILSAYFFIVDRDRILAVIKAHMPQWAGRYGLYLKGEVRHLIGGYFMAQFKIMAVVWLILTVGFIVLGVGYGPLWAFFSSPFSGFFLPVFWNGYSLLSMGLLFKLFWGGASTLFLRPACC